MADQQNDQAGKLAYPKYPCAPDRTRQLLEAIHGTFARELSMQLSAYLRCAIEIRQTGGEEYTFREWSSRRAAHSCTCSIGARPWELPVVVNLEPEIVFPMLEVMLGGKPQKQFAARELTAIEKNLLGIPLRSFAEKIQTAWGAVAKLNCRLEAIEDGITIRRLFAREEPLIGVDFEMTIAEHPGRMSILLPANYSDRSLEDYMANADLEASTRSDAAEVSALMLSASVRFEVSIERVSMQLGDLLNLREGYVIKFDHQTDRDVEGVLNGRPIFKGQVVSTGHKRAFLVSESGAASA